MPPVLSWCCDQIEAGEGRDGIYRLSGQASHIQSLRHQFDEGSVPCPLPGDLHAVASLLKLYFRELPASLLPASLYPSLVAAARLAPLHRLRALRSLVLGLPLPHLRTLRHLVHHLHLLSLAHRTTGMTSRNLAIVWAPNLLRAPEQGSQDCLRDIGVQALVIETLILHFRAVFEKGSKEHEEQEVEQELDLDHKFTQEVSIDQAVARAEKQEEEERPRRPMARSISCTRGLPGEVERRMGGFQRRGVILRRDRSLQQDDMTGRREGQDVRREEREVGGKEEEVNRGDKEVRRIYKDVKRADKETRRQRPEQEEERRRRREDEASETSTSSPGHKVKCPSFCDILL